MVLYARNLAQGTPYQILGVWEMATTELAIRVSVWTTPRNFADDALTVAIDALISS
jgi:hypothetical protein